MNSDKNKLMMMYDELNELDIQITQLKAKKNRLELEVLELEDKIREESERF